MQLTPGSSFGRYTIESRLGEGSIGVVYLASDSTLRRRVALKLLSQAFALDPEFRSRFVAEARSAAALDHPHVLPVYEAGEQDGQLYLATRYVPGLDLGRLIASDGPMSLSRSVRFLAQIAAALDAAHSSGLVHRNVRPNNIFIAAGDHAYVADFGLTAPISPSGTFTPPVLAPLRLEYIAPELLDGSPATPRSDIYALGCSLVECLIGARPRGSDTQLATQHTLAQDLDADMSSWRKKLPLDLAPVIERALARRPEDRYATATEFAVAVMNASGLSTAASPADAVARISVGQRPSTVHNASSRSVHALRLALVCLGSLVVFGATATAFVLNQSRLDGATPTASTPSLPVLAPTSSPQPFPTAALIGLRAEELILPLSEFPFVGHSVPLDQAVEATGWVRRYRATTTGRPFYDGMLRVWPTADAANSFMSTWLDGCPTARSTPLGGSSRACVKREAAPQASSISLLLIMRNVSVTFGISPSILANEAAAEERLRDLEAIGRAQGAWIDRIAPEDGTTPTRPSPMPTPRIVTLPNDQIVLPLADFPYRGWSVGADGVNSGRWYREFVSPETRAPLPNQKISVTVHVRPSVLDAEVSFTGGSKCDGPPGSAGVTYQRLPSTVGDDASVCLASVVGGSLQGILLTAVWRNVVVGVGSDVRGNESVEARIEELTTVAHSQFAVIDRLAPP